MKLYYIKRTHISAICDFLFLYKHCACAVPVKFSAEQTPIAIHFDFSG